MSLYIGALIILAIVVALVLIFRKLFKRESSEVKPQQEIAAKEVIKKEVSEFDPETGDKK
jgi:flagellar biogenesis protein FliO